MKYFYVALFAALGGGLRYGISLVIIGATATLLVNVIGAFLLGYFTNRFNALKLNDALKTGITGGFCGSFTTFSTFSKDAVLLLSSHTLYGMLYIVMTVFLGISAALIGMKMAVRTI